MAQIRVRRKRRPSLTLAWRMWPLLALGLLFLVGLALAGSWRRHDMTSVPAHGAVAAASVVSGQPTPGGTRSLGEQPDAATTAPTGAGARATGIASASDTAAPALAAEQVITGLPLGQPDRLEALAGRPTRLTNVRVQEVASEEIFWIGPNRDQRILVRLRRDGRPGQAVEGGVDVRPGQIANIMGQVRRLPSLEEVQQQWSPAPAALDALKGERVYVHVDDVRDFRVLVGQ